MKEIDQSEIKPRLIEMAKYFAKICDDNNLTYFMSGGTVLGAVRHKGFIPWDDDMDFHMPRADYDKLIEIMSIQDGRYKLLEHSINKEYGYPYAKLSDTTTVLIEKGGDCGVELGLNLDIFPLNGLGNSVKQAKKLMRKINPYIILNLSLLVSPWRKEVSFIKNFAIACIRVIAKMFTKERLLRNISKISATYDYESSAFIGEFVDEIGNKRIVKQEIYGKGQLLPFEDIKLNAPAQYHEFLTQFYGDYMTPPPEDKRTPVHDFKLYNKVNE